MAKAWRRIASIATVLVTVGACGPAAIPAVQSDVGITEDAILLGSTSAQSGTTSAYATISDAENAYFTFINNQGGINGRRITFKVLNDGYDPAQTVTLTKQLVEQDRVFALFGALGTKPQLAVRDYLNTQKVPQIFVSSGATSWGLDQSQHSYSLGWQPPYQAESRIYATDIVKNHPSAKIGILYQNDDYGQDYLKGLTDGLGATASMIADTQSYEIAAPNTTAQLAALRAKGVDTLFLFTTVDLTVKSLVAITAMHWEPAIYLNSVSNPQVYLNSARIQGAALKNVTSASYLKDPTDPRWANDAGMKRYREIIALCTSCKADDALNIFGVAQAYTMHDVFKQAGSNLTRANVRDIASSHLNEANNPFVLPGVVVRTSATDHFPIMQQQLMTWNGTGWTSQGGLINERGTLK
ncbi:MAG: ABC transporter substrate-binding protein [Candidatus Dormibacteraceae bacterium]